jgi:hypothetical protein
MLAGYITHGQKVAGSRGPVGWWQRSPWGRGDHPWRPLPMARGLTEPKAFYNLQKENQATINGWLIDVRRRAPSLQDKNSIGPGGLRPAASGGLGYETSTDIRDSVSRCPDCRRHRFPFSVAPPCSGNEMATPTMQTFPICRGPSCFTLSSRRRQMAPGPGPCGVPLIRPGWPVTEPLARSRRRCIWRSRRRDRSRASLCNRRGTDLRG